MGKQNIEEFLYRNRLKQKDLANYLNISETSVTRYIKGGGISSKNLAKLISNPYGWDTSMLCADGKSSNITVAGNTHASVQINSNNSDVSAQEVVLLKKEIDDLKEKLRKEEERSAQYLDIIMKLIGKNE